MSYGARIAPGFSPEQEQMLRVSVDELSRLPPDVRATLYLRALEVKAAQRGAFWNAVGAIVTGAAILGLVGSR